MDIKLEIIAVSVEDAVAAQQGGADRIELVAHLGIGGTTPSEHIIRQVSAAVSIPVYVMVRPRGGDAVYSREEIRGLLDAAQMVREAGADGIVVGASRPDGFVDVDVLAQVVEAARLPTTFHKAFDTVPERLMLSALDELAALPYIERVLTSAGFDDVMSGRHVLRRLVEHGSLSIMPGGGVTASNVRHLVSETGVREIHAGGAARIVPKTTVEAGSSAAHDDVSTEVPIYERPVQTVAVRVLKSLLLTETGGIA